MENLSISHKQPETLSMQLRLECCSIMNFITAFWLYYVTLTLIGYCAFHVFTFIDKAGENALTRINILNCIIIPFSNQRNTYVE